MSEAERYRRSSLLATLAFSQPARVRELVREMESIHGVVVSTDLVFVVNPSVQAKTLSEFIALAKSKPGYMTMASAGNGSPQHLAGEMFKRTAGVDILHVPYKGSGPAMTDLMGGQVLSMIETVPAAQGNIKAGKLRALAVTSPVRVDALPDVPTAAEAGL